MKLGFDLLGIKQRSRSIITIGEGEMLAQVYELTGPHDVSVPHPMTT